MENFFNFGPYIMNAIMAEQPTRVLEISGGGTGYGELIKASQRFCGIENGEVVRIALGGTPPGGGVYSRVLGEAALRDPAALAGFDLAVVTDYPERAEAETAVRLFDSLSRSVRCQTLVLTPLYTAPNLRRYHPVSFLGLDFAYTRADLGGGEFQVYNIFPRIDYTSPACDNLPVNFKARKLRVAFILPHDTLTGGMKGLLQIGRELGRCGNEVSLYLRADGAQNALPVWSGFSRDDFARQTVIPASSYFRDFIKDTDIIVLGWMQQIPEFLNFGVPTVLWEQGSEMLYGDFRKPLYSRSPERLSLHGFYRMPVGIAAVSPVVARVLSGVYGRTAPILPCGIDTDFYHPSPKENNPPVIMLCGNPYLSFKGFPFALAVLESVFARGGRFRAVWASPFAFDIPRTKFPLEVYINPPQTQLAQLYRSCDILLSSSLYESYPLPPLEAMASGTAVVAADCGGIHAYAKDGDNCLICPQGDAAAMSDALLMLLGDAAERERMARAGRMTSLTQALPRAAEKFRAYLSAFAAGRI